MTLRCCAALVVALLPAVALAADPPKKLGDTGYLHDQYHNEYQQFFAQMKCSCGVGECRPTDWRYSESSPVGYAVVIDGQWVDLGKETRFADPRHVSSLLRTVPAHVCAYKSSGIYVAPCALINPPPS